jgi:hypothetical protein
MDFTPRFHEPALLLMKATPDELKGINCEDTDVILIVRVEVRAMVGRSRLGEHANDDPEESGDLRHTGLESPEATGLNLAGLNELSHIEDSTRPTFSWSTCRSGYATNVDRALAWRTTRRMQVNA